VYSSQLWATAGALKAKAARMKGIERILGSSLPTDTFGSSAAAGIDRLPSKIHGTSARLVIEGYTNFPRLRKRGANEERQHGRVRSHRMAAPT
jgi:hypothetical protein